jgi:polyisoprenoid-binding protein YceI
MIYGHTVTYPMTEEEIVAIGFNATTTIKRSDFGMDQWLEMIGDELPITISFEAHKQ